MTHIQFARLLLANHSICSDQEKNAINNYQWHRGKHQYIGVLMVSSILLGLYSLYLMITRSDYESLEYPLTILATGILFLVFCKMYLRSVPPLIAAEGEIFTLQNHYIQVAQIFGMSLEDVLKCDHETLWLKAQQTLNAKARALEAAYKNEESWETNVKPKVVDLELTYTYLLRHGLAKKRIESYWSGHAA